jgi:hypothetical protein
VVLEGVARAEERLLDAVERLPADTSFAAQRGDGVVRRHAEQPALHLDSLCPRQERRRTLLGGTPRFVERLLHEIERLLRVAQPAGQIRVQPVLVPIHQAGELVMREPRRRARGILHVDVLATGR